MKMFLTRLGFGSRMAITGDVTQIDLPRSERVERSGMVQAMRILQDVTGLKIIKFSKEDVIRHPLVGRIVEAYDKQENSGAA